MALSLFENAELLCLMSHAVLGSSGSCWLRMGIITVEQTEAQRGFSRPHTVDQADLEPESPSASAEHEASHHACTVQLSTPARAPGWSCPQALAGFMPAWKKAISPFTVECQLLRPFQYLMPCFL